MTEKKKVAGGSEIHPFSFQLSVFKTMVLCDGRIYLYDYITGLSISRAERFELPSGLTEA